MNRRLSTVLIDGSTVETDYDAPRGRFRTLHILRSGVTHYVDVWDAGEAAAGHARTVRELTASINYGESRSDG